MTNHRTKTRRTPTDADLDALADKIELKAAIEARAEADPTTTSEIIREALRKFLDVA